MLLKPKGLTLFSQNSLRVDCKSASYMTRSGNDSFKFLKALSRVGRVHLFSLTDVMSICKD